MSVKRNFYSMILLFGCSAVAFEEPISFTVGDSPTDLKIVDLDQDGDLDIISLNAFPCSPCSIGVSLNQGDGTFQFLSDFPILGNSPSAFAIGDLDEDGFVDVAVVSNDVGTPEVLFNQGAGTFAAPVEVFNDPNSEPSDIEIADLDNDQHLDILVSSSRRAFMLMFSSFGDGTFSAPISIVGLGSDITSIELFDINNDSLLDIINSQGTSDGKVEILSNQGNKTFSSSNFIQIIGERPQQVVIGDLNEDNLPDLAVITSGENSTDPEEVVTDFHQFVVLFNLGDQRFDEEKVIKHGFATTISIFDINVDGKPDLIEGNNDFLGIWTKNIIRKKPQFIELPINFPNSTSFAFGDLNNDSLPDIITQGASEGDPLDVDNLTHSIQILFNSSK